MYSRLLLLLLILLTHPARLSAQQHPAGGILPEDEQYRRQTLRTTARTSKPGSARTLRADFDIPALDQGYMPACGCCALAQALAIRRKQFFDRKCPGEHPLEVFSWSYLFNQLCPPNRCDSGIYLSAALDLLSREGICLSSVFPNNGYGCDPLPADMLKSLAAQAKIWQSKRVFELPEENLAPGDTAGLRALREKIVQTVIAEIDQHNPVIVTVWYGGDYEPCDALFSNPRTDMPPQGHALLLTGYDDRAQTVELLNSFGPNWCDRGFARARYDDFARVVRYGYVLVLEEPACR